MRRLWLAGALALGAALWWGPLPALAPESFAAHMLLHMAVAAGVAPLLAFGLARSRWDPARRWPRWLLPVPASMLEFLVVWGWHTPSLHHLARHHSMGLALEQAIFLGASFLVWIASVGGGADRGGSRAAAGLLGLLLTFMHMVLLGVLLAVTPRPLFPHGLADEAALADQHLGGVIMIVGATTWLAGGLWLTLALLRRGARRQERFG